MPKASREPRAAPGGRPPVWTIAKRAEIVARVCEAVARGDTVLHICPRRVPADKIEQVPCVGTFFTWLLPGQPRAKEFDALYQRARQLRLDGDEDRIRIVAFDGSNDTYIDDNGNTRTDVDVIQRSKLIVNTLQWTLSKRRPREWGDKLDVTSDGKPVGAVAMPGFVPLGAPLDAADSAHKPPAKKGKKQ